MLPSSASWETSPFATAPLTISLPYNMRGRMDLPTAQVTARLIKLSHVVRPMCSLGRHSVKIYEQMASHESYRPLQTMKAIYL
jgi:hypothetical protein